MSIRDVWQQLAGQPEAVVSTRSAEALGQAALRAVGPVASGLVVAHPTWPALPTSAHGRTLRRPGPATNESWLLVLEPAGGLGLAVRSSTGLEPPFAVAGERPISVRVTADPGLLLELGAGLAAAATVDDPAASAAMRRALAAEPSGARRAEPGPDGRVAAMLLEALASADQAARGDRQAGRHVVRDFHQERHTASARLHDGPVQDLTAALLLIDAKTDAAPAADACGALPTDEPPGSALQALRRAIAGLRRVMHDLSRDLMTGHELEAAVRDAGAPRAACHVDVPDAIRSVHPDLVVAGHHVTRALLDEMAAGDRLARGQIGVAGITVGASERALGIELVGDGIDGLDLAAVVAVARLWSGHVERSPVRLRVELPLPDDAADDVEDP